MELRLRKLLWKLILFIKLIGLQSAEIVSQTVFGGVHKVIYINIWNRLSKAACPPLLDGPHSINWRAEKIQWEGIPPAWLLN
jgi:hypothetical protein